jgi:hypothetical protein
MGGISPFSASDRRREGLKFPREMPISGIGMGHLAAMRRILALGLILVCFGPAEAAKKKAAIPLVASEPKKDQTIVVPQPPKEAEPGKPGTTFAELNFNRTLVIEGKVEKPQVTFTLLKEPPPEKEIRFETSFMQNILKLDRENTFKAGETYGRE